jgi:hypothetical protein
MQALEIEEPEGSGLQRQRARNALRDGHGSAVELSRKIFDAVGAQQRERTPERSTYPWQLRL